MRIVWSFSMEGDNIFPYRNMDIKLGDREMERDRRYMHEEVFNNLKRMPK